MRLEVGSGDDEEDSSVKIEDSDVEEADSDAEEMDSDIKDSVVEWDSSNVEELDSDNGEPAEFFGRRVSNNEGLNLGEPEEEEEVTFWLFVALIEDYEMRDIYMPGLPGLYKHIAVLEYLMERYLPTLY